MEIETQKTGTEVNAIDVEETAVTTNDNTTNNTTTATTEQVQTQGQPQPQNMEYTSEDVEKRQAIEREISQDLESKGVSWEALNKEYYETGDLSSATRAQLEKAGYPKAVIDNYINGLQMESERFTNAVFNHVGGEEEFSKIAQFVQSKGDGAVKAFNNIVQSGDINSLFMVLNGLKAEMITKYGTNNPTILGNTTALGGQLQGFEDELEMQKAMSDPRYGRNRKYTREIEERVKLSSFFN